MGKSAAELNSRSVCDRSAAKTLTVYKIVQFIFSEFWFCFVAVIHVNEEIKF